MRFKTAFSVQNMKNLILISTLMIFENSINCILRFFVGIKDFFTSQEQSKFVYIFEFAEPLIFATVWFYIWHISKTKNGHYGAPISILKYQNDQKANSEETRTSTDENEEFDDPES